LHIGLELSIGYKKGPDCSEPMIAQAVFTFSWPWFFWILPEE
jgi:hypothetical protein